MVQIVSATLQDDKYDQSGLTNPQRRERNEAMINHGRIQVLFCDITQGKVSHCLQSESASPKPG